MKNNKLIENISELVKQYPLLCIKNINEINDIIHIEMNWKEGQEKSFGDYWFQYRSFEEEINLKHKTKILIDYV